jgi:hypothetical protein
VTTAKEGVAGPAQNKYSCQPTPTPAHPTSYRHQDSAGPPTHSFHTTPHHTTPHHTTPHHTTPHHTTPPRPPPSQSLIPPLFSAHCLPHGCAPPPPSSIPAGGASPHAHCAVAVAALAGAPPGWHAPCWPLRPVGTHRDPWHARLTGQRARAHWVCAWVQQTSTLVPALWHGVRKGLWVCAWVQQTSTLVPALWHGVGVGVGCRVWGGVCVRGGVRVAALYKGQRTLGHHGCSLQSPVPFQETSRVPSLRSILHPSPEHTLPHMRIGLTSSAASCSWVRFWPSSATCMLQDLRGVSDARGRLCMMEVV